jgi:thiamine pyrophosphate-dependent acetolactate synthase large subunit-like protein
MMVHNALVGCGLRDRIKIGGSGKVATGSDIVKRLAQGADYTNAARYHHAMPGDVGVLDAPDTPPHFVFTGHHRTVPDTESLNEAARLLDGVGSVTLLVGAGARHARQEVLALADRLAAPMVLTLKGKEGLAADNPHQVGQSGLIGNPAAQHAFDSCDVLLMLGTDSPTPTGPRRARRSSRSTSAERTSAGARA